MCECGGLRGRQWRAGGRRERTCLRDEREVWSEERRVTRAVGGTLLTCRGPTAGKAIFTRENSDRPLSRARLDRGLTLTVT